jgi:hypothetical protein
MAPSPATVGAAPANDERVPMRSITMLATLLLMACPTTDDDDFSRTEGPCFLDQDGDGYGHPAAQASITGACGDFDSEVLNGTDCDDTSADINPGATEIPDDWIDQDCDGQESVTCMPDLDGDGYGAPPNVIEEDGDCDEEDLRPTWDFVDCDDDEASINSGATEIPEDGIDQDCDGVDSPLCYYDGDEDGFGAGDGQPGPAGHCDHEFLSPIGGDCDDSADWINPLADEVPDDGWDQDCTGTDAITCLLDGDGDGWPGLEGVLEEDGECDAGQLPAWMATDCDDGNPNIHPFALDPPDDGIDQDCTESDAVSCFWDQDGDGVGAAWAIGEEDCEEPGQVAIGGDCNDLVPSVHPGATEVLADGIDQDCDGLDAIACFEDIDGDGYGAGVAMETPGIDCGGPGFSAFGGDCNDTTATISPASFDVPDDGVDQDCSGIDAANCFYDGDEDGFGWWSTVYDLDGNCTDDPFQSPYSSDCNDFDPLINPTAVETVDDGIDDDCDGTDAVTCFLDDDGDGHAGATTGVDPDGACWDDPGQGETTDDCDDTDPLISPSAGDTPDDGIDQDCNGIDAAWCFPDWDQDGYGFGSGQASATGCVGVYDALLGGDCDDGADWISPGDPEIPGDAYDSDCDGDPEN